ncbi:nucleotidyltransferase family protein [Bacteroides sp.]|uniref:nucleotidyltransferase family protein n=1 Tax=Bacteroides sp. TaxID=29523 RepID=UPI0026269233|nr:nucleotidyltransferase family protein [Bacteroides sp.]MDD3038212.1 nucleotidyltransferase family protein [Bacteroides sp.]
MKAMIFAAGLGTRLKPLTDTMPKALVPIAGRPMLEYVILKLKASGFTEIVINIHHFGDQILDFLKANQNFGLIIHISDERDFLLDTGGGIKKARPFFENSDEPFLIHNVDILSDINLKELYDYHIQKDSVATLLASRRKTSRYLLFDEEKKLCGWINKDTEQVKPEGFYYDETLYREYAFSGIHVLSPTIFRLMDAPCWEGKFSIMDFYLATCRQADFTGYLTDNLQLIDIGKPETLAYAEELSLSFGILF